MNCYLIDNRLVVTNTQQAVMVELTESQLRKIKRLE